MNTLDNEVRSVVQGLMSNSELFTALDVSNKVKMTFPFARHREIRDLVRGMFTTDIESAGWARTPITVTLPDGQKTDALLYHPLGDAWDLDNKYDAQRRAQGTVQVTAPAPVSTSLSSVVLPTTTTAVPPTTPAATATLTPVQAKDRWAQLFNSQPSLFPLK